MRVNRILDAVSNAEFEVKIKAVDVSLLISSFQKIANRITSGLILASLIIGAALLMQVHTNFTIFGYPGFAMLCFLLAGALGFFLVINIFISDYRDKKKVSCKLSVRQRAGYNWINFINGCKHWEAFPLFRLSR